jgi:hypothetical protein
VTYTAVSPLEWPVSWARSRSFSNSRFGGGRGVSVAFAIGELGEEMRRLGVSDLRLSCNVRLRRDGGFDGGAPEPSDRAVAVYFRLKGQEQVLACDKWTRVGDNFLAIAKHVEAVRGQVRWGVGSLEQAFGGYKALLAVGAKRPWHVVLALSAQASWEAVVAKREELLRQHHPDRGGNAEQAAEINSAFDDAKRIFGQG